MIVDQNGLAGTMTYKPYIYESGADPVLQPGDRFVVYSNARLAKPLRDDLTPLTRAPTIYEVDTVTPDAPPLGIDGNYTVTYLVPPGHTKIERGDEIYQVSPVRDIVGERAPKVQYVLDEEGVVDSLHYGTLRRVRFTGSAQDYSTGNLEVVDLLDRVVQFQVQFLVWPCENDSTQPIWMDNPDNDNPNLYGLYSDPMYFAGESSGTTSIAKAYRARRARIHAVRVSIARLESLR